MMKSGFMKLAICGGVVGAAFSVAAVAPASAQQPTGQTPAYGPELEGFDYPYPVQRFTFTSQRQQLQMAYLDVKPDHPNGQTVFAASSGTSHSTPATSV